MVGCLVKAAIKLVMQSHHYSFNIDIRKQMKGVSIGNTLPGKLVKLLLKSFDKKYKSLLRKLKKKKKIEIELYERYVDDVTEGLVELDPGVRFDPEKC